MENIQKAIEQVKKELVQRYDLKDANAEIELDKQKHEMTIVAPSDFVAGQIIDIVNSKLIKRKIDLGAVRWGDPQAVSGGRVKKEAHIVSGIDKDTLGKINKSLVAKLDLLGGRAMGISGMDGGLIEAAMADPRLGYVGEVKKVNPRPILDLLEKGYIPVVSTIGCNETGHVFNINADTAAAKIAIAVGAEKLILLTDIRGLLRDRNDEDTLISQVRLPEVPELVEQGVISGGMIPKIACCQEAIRRGVKKVFIVDGRVPHSLLIELFTDEGIGTMMKKEETL